MRQQSLFSKEIKKELSRKFHGSDLHKGKRKKARPFSPKKPLHIVMRSSCAKGVLSFLQPQNKKIIGTIINLEAKRNHIQIFEFANSGNHLHILIRAKNREGLGSFLKATAGLIARRLTGAKKGKPFGKKFWDSLSYSRIVEWGRDFFNVKVYVFKNILESARLGHRGTLEFDFLAGKLAIANNDSS